MTTQTHSETSESKSQSAGPNLGELPFSEYVAARQGKEVKGASGEAGKKSAPEAKTSEQKHSSESGTGEGEAKDQTDEDETDADGSDEDLEASGSDDAKPKKKGGFQRRIDKLNAAKAEAQREANYWREQALKGAGEQKKETKVDSKPATGDGKPKAEDFETHAEWVDAMTDWKLDQREKAQSQKAEKTRLETEQAEVQKAFKERVDAFHKSHPDFKEMLSDMQEYALSPALETILKTSDNGPELMYAMLKKGRTEIDRINSMGPMALAREIGRIEAGLTANSADDDKPETKKTTSAPKPISPLGKSSGATAKSIHDPNISFAEFERQRRAQNERR